MEQNYFKLTHLPFSLRFEFVFQKAHPYLAVWLLLCFVYFDYHFYGFFCTYAPPKTGISIWMKPPDKIMKNARKQNKMRRRREEGEKMERYYRRVTQSLSYASWVSICLTDFSSIDAWLDWYIRVWWTGHWCHQLISSTGQTILGGRVLSLQWGNRAQSIALTGIAILSVWLTSRSTSGWVLCVCVCVMGIYRLVNEHWFFKLSTPTISYHHHQ